ncbi:hypothetical protein L1987_37710 [Smallanthus sonchifolius]|uniref:Uncharacterized protein n=1 Tax=Smallanthus sonchifolius TaxID=185202 RepID=A0ACB9HHU4_9ASTR|nr:hypothetical protein L1987_37710 [Smallanthus sonchifolius]
MPHTSQQASPISHSRPHNSIYPPSQPYRSQPLSSCLPLLLRLPPLFLQLRPPPPPLLQLLISVASLYCSDNGSKPPKCC